MPDEKIDIPELPRKLKTPSYGEARALAKRLVRVGAGHAPSITGRTSSEEFRRYAPLASTPEYRRKILGWAEKAEQAEDAAIPPIRSYKHGGAVQQTGPAFLHKGEVVVPAKENRLRRFQHDRSEKVRALFNT